MSDENTVHVVVDDDGIAWQIMPDGSRQQMEDNTDWDRLDAMTEEEIEANALSDPDNPPLTAEDLARFMRVPNSKSIREKLGMSVEEFGDTFRLNRWEIQRWESGKARPTWEANLLLRVIGTHPEAVIDAIRQYSQPLSISDDDENTNPIELNQPAPEGRRYRSAG